VRTYYDRQEGESLLQYCRRLVVTTTVWYVVLGLPLLALIAYSKGQSPVAYLKYRGILLYFAVIVGMLGGRLLREGLIATGFVAKPMPRAK